MITFRLSLLICFAALFFSCKKEESVSQGSRLKMIRYKEGDSLGYRSFQYDGQQRVVGIIDSSNNGYKYTTYITYDAQGKLSKVIDGGTTYTFELDDKGRIIKKSATHQGQQGTIVTDTYYYDTNNRLIADSLHDYWTNNIWRIVSYSYDQSNNVVESTIIDNNSSSISTHRQCTYDNHSSPLENLGIMIYLLEPGYEIPYGKNNLISVKYDDGTTISYTYEYKLNGLPIKSSWQDNTDPMIVYVDYYYE